MKFFCLCNFSELEQGISFVINWRRDHVVKPSRVVGGHVGKRICGCYFHSQIRKFLWNLPAMLVTNFMLHSFYFIISLYAMFYRNFVYSHKTYESTQIQLKYFRDWIEKFTQYHLSSIIRVLGYYKYAETNQHFGNHSRKFNQNLLVNLHTYLIMWKCNIVHQWTKISTIISRSIVFLNDKDVKTDKP